MTEPTDALTLKPDWSRGCMNCDQKPVVTATNGAGEVLYDSELCGPCTWGEADTIDPENR